MFHTRVINKAMEEINAKTNIHIRIDDIEKIGRKVMALTFVASRKLDFQHEELEDKVVVEKLTSCGFNITRAKQIVKKHDKEYILANIAVVEEQYMKKGKLVKSVPALLTTAFKTDFRAPETEYTKQQNSKAKEKKIEQEASEKAKEQEAELQQAFQEKTKKLFVKRRNKLPGSEIEEYKSTFLNQLGDMHIASRYIEKEGFDHRVVQASFTKFLREQLLSVEELDFTVFKMAKSKEPDQNGAE